MNQVISQLKEMQAEQQNKADEQAQEARHQKSIADRDAADDSGMTQNKKMRSKETHGPRPSKLDDDACRMDNGTRRRKERTKGSELPEGKPTRPPPTPSIDSQPRQETPAVPERTKGSQLPQGKPTRPPPTPGIDSQPRQETPAVPAAKKLSTRLSRFFSPLPLPRPFLNSI